MLFYFINVTNNQGVFSCNHFRSDDIALLQGALFLGGGAGIPTDDNQ